MFDHHAPVPKLLLAPFPLFFLFFCFNNLLHGARRQTVASTKYLLRYKDKEKEKRWVKEELREREREEMVAVLLLKEAALQGRERERILYLYTATSKQVLRHGGWDT